MLYEIMKQNEFLLFQFNSEVMTCKLFCIPNQNYIYNIK